MLTLPTLIGLVWVLLSFICLLALPFAILAYMIRRKHNWIEIILVQVLSWILLFTFVHLIFGGFWFFSGIIGPALSMG
ncbi:MAG: hypothetical protein DRP00_00570 [Candidatus Aenigmatarchaeota archaeon]|nr:MAG: hypothetical protein DRP00_00570 [Candidatus Aenigmarchaeota archaeon]